MNKEEGPGATGSEALEEEAEGRNSSRAGEGEQSAAGNRPATINGDLHNLPAALAPLVALDHWVVWRWARVKDKWTKIPYRPSAPKRPAKNNDPSTWSSYATAIAAFDAGKCDGIGFCILGSDFTMFDLDDCRDPATGALAPWAQQLVNRAGSYAEVTISGSGLRVIGTGTGPKLHRKQTVVGGGSVETYRNAERYVVVTGNALPGAPAQLVDISAVADEVVAEHEKKPANGADTDARPLDLDYLIRTGDAGHWNGDRSKAVWYVACELLRHGRSTEEVAKVLLNAGNRISDHVYDQSNPKLYAERQVEKAAKAVAKDAVPHFDKVVITRDKEQTRWAITIADQVIVLSSSEVLNQRALIDRCFALFGMSWVPLSRPAWKVFLDKTYAEAEKYDEDSVHQEQFVELLTEYLTNRQTARDREDLLGGRPWLNEDRGRYEFRMQFLEQFLWREGPAWLRQRDRRDIQDRIREMGGGPVGKAGTSVKGKSIRLWWVPSSAIDPPVPIPPPRQPESPI